MSQRAIASFTEDNNLGQRTVILAQTFDHAYIIITASPVLARGFSYRFDCPPLKLPPPHQPPIDIHVTQSLDFSCTTRSQLFITCI